MGDGAPAPGPVQPAARQVAAESPGSVPVRPAGCAQPGRCPPPLWGVFFSQAPMKHSGDGAGTLKRTAGDRVQRLLDAPAADLMGPELLQERRPLRIPHVPGVLGRGDPLPDRLINSRCDVFPPERFGEFQEMPGVRHELLRGPDVLQRGPLRFVGMHDVGQHRLPRGPVSHPFRVRRDNRDGPGPRRCDHCGPARRHAGSRRRRRPPARRVTGRPGPAARSPHGCCSPPARGSPRRRTCPGTCPG